jgi:hypothetical protein
MVFTFVNNATGSTYILNQTMMDQASAERMCNLAGGHLAAWQSLEEQVRAAYQGGALCLGASLQGSTRAWQGNRQDLQ